ncbi:MAG: hypothetical protein AAFZ58_06385 [Pseudomonadota bacterium]
MTDSRWQRIDALDLDAADARFANAENFRRIDTGRSLVISRRRLTSVGVAAGSLLIAACVPGISEDTVVLLAIIVLLAIVAFWLMGIGGGGGEKGGRGGGSGCGGGCG